MSELIVYALSHPVTGELRYIGKSECGLKRPRQHGQLSSFRRRGHLPLVRWIKKLRAQGLDYIIEIVEEHTVRADLIEAERFYISYFRSLGFRLLNICDGGEGFTAKHTPEARRKIGEAWRGKRRPEETRRKMSEARRGHVPSDATRALWSQQRRGKKRGPMSQETRVLLSAAHRGRKLSAEHVLNMSQGRGGRPFVDGKGIVYQTQREAARALGLDQGSISSVLRGKSRHAKGHTFRYVE